MRAMIKKLIKRSSHKNDQHESMSTFPTLHGEATSGKTKVWTIQVFSEDGNGVIRTIRGYLDGKMQENDKTITTGKNIGKKNETTPLQQAISEARAMWVKMKENGYAESIGSQGASSVSEPLEPSRGKGITADAPLPMLAHDYHKRGKSMNFPCYSQRKLDGVRCVAIPQKGLFSRLRKEFPHMEHIKEEINRLPSSLVLDGELYTNSIGFQEIVGMVKRETLKAGDEDKQRKIQYHVYDIISEKPYEERLKDLHALFRTYRFQHLVMVETAVCRSEEEMKQQHAQYVADGYEGIMLRAPRGLYKNSRSVDLLKYKEFFDDEYEVVDFREGEGLERGCVIWTCRTAEGSIFHCRPRGTHEERAEWFQNGNQYVGQKLTVRFQEKTDDGLPRFPVGIAFRNYE